MERLRRGLRVVDVLRSGCGWLMYGRPSSLIVAGCWSWKSAIDGSGVVSLKDEMYRVSAILKFSRISSRTSISSARRYVS